MIERLRRKRRIERLERIAKNYAPGQSRFRCQHCGNVFSIAARPGQYVTQCPGCKFNYAVRM